MAELRQLGSTGIHVSELGFGTWGLSGTSYGPVDDQESRRAIARAFELGTTFFDTADLYGDGHSEEVLGSAVRRFRDRVVIATKGGSLPHTGFVMPQDFSSTYLEGALEKSLKRLGTDYIDLYQLHSPDIHNVNWESVLPCLTNLVTSGKIRSFGVSARVPKDALWLLERYEIPALQVNFNLIDHRVIETGLLDVVRTKQVGLIARTPLCFGFLTGGINEDTEFADGDHRKLWPREQIKRWVKGVELFRPIYERHSQTAVDLALRYCISFGEVSTVIPGMMTVKEVEDNTRSISFGPLAPSELEEIAKIYKSTQFFDPQVKVEAIDREKQRI